MLFYGVASYAIFFACFLYSIAFVGNFDIVPGDTVTIPQHAAQSVTSTGDTDLVFLCLCTPRFLQDCYTSLE